MKVKRANRRKAVHLIRVVSCIFLFLFTSIAIYIFVFSNLTRIDIINTKGDLYQNEVEQATRARLQELWLRVIPRDKLLTLSKTALIDSIANKVPEIKKIKISRGGTNTIVVEYSLRTPKFVTENGMILDEDNLLYRERRDTQILPILVATSTKIEINDYKKIIEMVDKITVRLFPVAEVIVDSYGDVFFFDKDRRELRFSLHGNQNEIWSRLLSALDTSPLKNIVYKNEFFAYIDVRFGDKVFYSLKKQILTSTTTHPLSSSIISMSSTTLSQ